MEKRSTKYVEDRMSETIDVFEDTMIKRNERALLLTSFCVLFPEWNRIKYLWREKGTKIVGRRVGIRYKNPSQTFMIIWNLRLSFHNVGTFCGRRS